MMELPPVQNLLPACATGKASFPKPLVPKAFRGVAKIPQVSYIFGNLRQNSVQ